MNNNGVNDTNTNANINQQNVSVESTLAPMAGVRIAPASDGPVNASNSHTATSANASLTMTTPTPVITSSITASPIVATQPVTIQQQSTLQPQVENIATTSNQVNAVTEKVKKEKKGSLSPILILIIIGLGAYIYVNQMEHNSQIANLNYNCTPITASNEEVKLDLNSTLVQDLYNKFATTIREDIAEPDFNDSMKIYLAYRQVTDKDKYSSNCGYFSKTSMEPFVCEETTSTKPLAIKEDVIVRELKVLFGEKTNIPLQNIQLRTSCIGGYQYIAERGEFVQGKCTINNATSFKVTKKLVDATSTRNTIVLKEDVKYHENEKMQLPAYLKSGYYYYTFRLDMNYNYVLVEKRYESKY